MPPVPYKEVIGRHLCPRTLLSEPIIKVLPTAGLCRKCRQTWIILGKRDIQPPTVKEVEGRY